MYLAPAAADPVDAAGLSTDAEAASVECDKAALRLFNSLLKAGRQARALELVGGLASTKSIQGEAQKGGGCKQGFCVGFSCRVPLQGFSGLGAHSVHAGHSLLLTTTPTVALPFSTLAKWCARCMHTTVVQLSGECQSCAATG